MLVVKVELWPGGCEERSREIGRMLIDNTTYERDARRGDYRIRLMRKGARTVQRSAKVLNYPRLSYPVWKLVRRALRALDV